MSTSTDLRAAIAEIREGIILPERKKQWLAEKLDEAYRKGALDKLYERIGAVPWWVISTGLHAAVFLLITLVAVAAPPPPEETVVITAEVVRARPEPYVPVTGPRPPLFGPVDPSKYDPNVTMPVPADDLKFEPANNPGESDLVVFRGDPDNRSIEDDFAARAGVVGVIGLSPGGGPSGCYGIRADRSARAKAISRHRGSGTEGPVEAALQWLARHQEVDGSWDPVKYEARHGSNVRYRVGVTALALLAFLGRGETHRNGPFAHTVRRAELWLMKQQKPNGGIFEQPAGGSAVSAGYNHALAGLALAEAFGMTGPAGRDEYDLTLGAAAQKAVDYSVGVHQAAYSGWRYDAREAADLSATGWFVMQLKSARLAGLRVDGRGFQGAAGFLDKVADREGGARYTAERAPTSAMTAVGLVCRQFMGAPAADPLVAKGPERLLQDLPNWQTAAATAGDSGVGDKGFYYWYYGTLGMFQTGGEPWNKWNEAVKGVLVPNQCRGGEKDGSVNDKDGSWDPQSWIDQHGGRAFTTAMGALTLEVYYRYLPINGR